MESPEFRDPDFVKQIAVVKYMSEGWQVGDVQAATKTILDPRTRAQRDAMGRLLRNLDAAFYSGNHAWIPQSFDGLEATIGASSTDQIFDLRGGNLTENYFELAGQLITEGNGNAEGAKIYVSPAGVQNISKIIRSGATTNGNLKIAEMGDGNLTLGGRAKDIMTGYGLMTPRMDKVLGMCFENKVVPQYYNKTTSTWTEDATSDKAPSTPSIVLTNNATAVARASQFTTGITRPSGVKYSYRVVARNAYGQSAACAAVESTSIVADGGSVSIAITPAPGDSGSKSPTCFEIYSTKVGGSGVYRYMTTVAAAATAPLSAVTYEDTNDYIPGTSRMYIVDQSGAGEDRVMSYSQLLPIHNTDLAKMGRYSQGLINLYGVPKYYKPQVLVEFRNINVDQSFANKLNFV